MRLLVRPAARPSRWRSVMQVRAGLMHGVWPLLGRSQHVEARAFALTPHDASETQAQRQAAIEVRRGTFICLFVEMLHAMWCVAWMIPCARCMLHATEAHSMQRPIEVRRE
jgi:hypothetical protein